MFHTSYRTDAGLAGIRNSTSDRELWITSNPHSHPPQSRGRGFPPTPLPVRPRSSLTNLDVDFLSVTRYDSLDPLPCRIGLVRRGRKKRRKKRGYVQKSKVSDLNAPQSMLIPPRISPNSSGGPVRISLIQNRDGSTAPSPHSPTKCERSMHPYTRCPEQTGGSQAYPLSGQCEGGELAHGT